MFYSICYDIVDNRRRNRIAKILLDYGERVQYSVFEVDIDAKQLETLMGRMKRELNDSEDSVLIYALCETCKTKLKIIGQDSNVSYPDVYIV